MFFTYIAFDIMYGSSIISYETTKPLSAVITAITVVHVVLLLVHPSFDASCLNFPLFFLLF